MTIFVEQDGNGTYTHSTPNNVYYSKEVVEKIVNDLHNAVLGTINSLDTDVFNKVRPPLSDEEKKIVEELTKRINCMIDWNYWKVKQ